MIEKQGYIKRVGSKYALTSHKTKISDEIVQFYKRMEKKLIPEDVAEKGCSHWSDDEPHPLTLVIIGESC